MALLVALALGAGMGVITYRAYLLDKKEQEHAADAAGPEAPPGDPVGPDGEVLAEVVGVVDNSDVNPGNRFPAQFTTSSLYPNFHPDRSHYVTRCLPGRVNVQVNSEQDIQVKVGANQAESGRYMAEARLMPGQDFDVVVAAHGDRDRETYQVRCLPADFPLWTYKRFAKPPKGMFMVNVFLKRSDISRPWLIVFDEHGMPRWWYSPPFNTLGGQILADGTVHWPRGFGDGFGQDTRTTNEIRSLDGRLLRTVDFQGAPTDGHDYILLPNGNALVMSYAPRLGVDLTSVGGPEDAGVLDGAIQEVTPDGEVVWDWNSKDHVPLTGTPERWWEARLPNRHWDHEGNARTDIFHLNSYEPWGEQMVLSARHTDRVWGISRETGEVLWTLGGDQWEKSLEVVGDDPHKDYPLSGNHDARMYGNVLSVHDNGSLIDGRAPRLVLYRIDLDAGTATFLRQYQDLDAAPDSHCCGGARKMGDGWVVAWGQNDWVSGFNSEHELAFRLGLPAASYRAVPVPDSVTAGDLDRGLEGMEPHPPVSDIPVKPLQRHDN